MLPFPLEGLPNFDVGEMLPGFSRCCIGRLRLLVSHDIIADDITDDVRCCHTSGWSYSKGCRALECFDVERKASTGRPSQTSLRWNVYRGRRFPIRVNSASTISWPPHHFPPREMMWRTLTFPPCEHRMKEADVAA